MAAVAAAPWQKWLLLQLASNNSPLKVTGDISAFFWPAFHLRKYGRQLRNRIFVERLLRTGQKNLFVSFQSHLVDLRQT